jgi:hypothetical protein
LEEILENRSRHSAFCSFRICPGPACRFFPSLRPRECPLQGEAGRIPSTLAQPDPGKARVYFFQDAGTSHTLGYPTVKLAIDGAWVGANHGNSYFSVSVEPGEHHVCVTLQSSLVAQRVELTHFTAEAEKVYHYRTRLVMSRTVELLDLDPIDSDQGKYLIASFPLSVSNPKK